MGLNKSFSSQLITGVGSVIIRKGTSTINITHKSGGTGTVTVTDMGNDIATLNKFTIDAGETVTLSNSNSNASIKIENTAGSDARIIYYF